MSSVSSTVHSTTQTMDFWVFVAICIRQSFTPYWSECKQSSQLSLSIANCPCELNDLSKRFQAILNCISFKVETTNQINRLINEVNRDNRKAFQCKLSIQGPIVHSTTNSGIYSWRIPGKVCEKSLKNVSNFQTTTQATKTLANSRGIKINWSRNSGWESFESLDIMRAVFYFFPKLLLHSLWKLMAIQNANFGPRGNQEKMTGRRAKLRALAGTCHVHESYF